MQDNKDGKCFSLRSIQFPTALMPVTASLVVSFSEALAAKLAKAQEKYGYSSEWANPENVEFMLKDMHRHIDKGDPMDVAAFAMFLWYHKASTKLTQTLDTQETG